jgi:hypothetical protein
MKIFAALALAAAAALPVSAQLAYPDGLGAQARAAADKSKARTRALDAALVAMNDGPEAGGLVLRALDEAKIGVSFATQDAAVATGVVNGKPAILLSDALPAHPRVYAPLIAAEAAKGLFSDMPACAEREYMRAAIAARVFAELGGDFKSLPVVDGDRVPAVRDAVAAWTQDAQTALETISKATGLLRIPDLQSAARDAKQTAELDAANKSFVSFLIDERDARRAAGR